MNDQYLDTVRLMLAVTPDVFDTPHFAKKGGTAINQEALRREAFSALDRGDKRE
jgi:hypothetical protein